MAVFLCTLETTLALFCVNIPLLRPLYRRFIVRQSSSKLDESGRNYGSKYRAGESNLGSSRNADLELDSYNKDRGFEHSAYVEEGSVSGDNSSEKRLNSYNKAKGSDILVKTEWTVQSNR